MKKLSLRSRLSNGFLEIPVDFIDTYMPQASSEALKVYLYLLRSALDPSILLSVSDMADLFDVTPNRILSALSYWESQHLLKLDYEAGELSDITILPMTAALPEKTAEKSEEAPKAVSAELPVNVTPLPAKDSSPVMDPSVLYGDPQFDELLGVAERYFKRPLTPTQRDSLGVCCLMFDRQYDVIEYLLEYCLDQGKNSFRYIEAVARGWKEDGLKNLSEIRAASSRRKKSVYSVMSAYGLRDRQPSPKEEDMINGWSADFELPVILLACERTMNAIHTPSFQYTDSILASWKKAGVRTENDVAQLDEKYRSMQKKDSGQTVKRSQNSFQNFEQRNTDLNALVSGFYEA